MLQDFNKIMKRLFPDASQRVEAKKMFDDYKLQQGVFTKDSDSDMWDKDYIKSISTVSWWEGEAAGGGQFQAACIRVHSCYCAAMDVERKNSAMGAIKSKKRNKMGLDKQNKSTRFFCNSRFRDQVKSREYKEKYMVWEEEEYDGDVADTGCDGYDSEGEPMTLEQMHQACRDDY